MRSIVIILFVLLASPAALAEARFVGFSSAAFDGNQGVRTYTEACRSDFLSGAYICTSEELLGTTSWPVSSSAGPGWVRPVYQPVQENTAVMDASGHFHQAFKSLACNGWSSDSVGVVGLRVDSDGRFTDTACNISNEVDCCISTPSGLAPAFPAWAISALSPLLIGSTGWLMATRQRDAA
jgi:hypothetical protein